MVDDVLHFYQFIIANSADNSLLSAIFDWDGRRVVGSERIEVERMMLADGRDPDRWWYRIKPIKDYDFIRLPLPPSVGEDIGYGKYDLKGRAHLPGVYDQRLAEEFRYVALDDQKDERYFPPNARVKFLVVGYPLAALLMPAPR